jgi:hypothetical protein
MPFFFCSTATVFGRLSLGGELLRLLDSHPRTGALALSDRWHKALVAELTMAESIEPLRRFGLEKTIVASGDSSVYIYVMRITPSALIIANGICVQLVEDKLLQYRAISLERYRELRSIELFRMGGEGSSPAFGELQTLSWPEGIIKAPEDPENLLRLITSKQMQDLRAAIVLGYSLRGNPDKFIGCPSFMEVHKGIKDAPFAGADRFRPSSFKRAATKGKKAADLEALGEDDLESEDFMDDGERRRRVESLTTEPSTFMPVVVALRRGRA